ncbi:MULTISPECIES: hypothetical protein [Polyangium]|uniref:Uncharacterized protein n=2 Tax=Polyangium TaxID=55 RepID=A0A4U1JM43_9BACT|nr:MULTISPECIES: hypothetical protein [Polyangium]MDI1431953.1 hypothetical protein [Polyangium sorediatum]TKD13200.1 hypothetical protein E8A74_01195 [Polyangium fumosum]
MSGVGAGLLSLASVAVLTLLGVGLVTVGLGTVKKVHGPAGFCLAGAGALIAFASILRQLLSFALSFAGMRLGTMFTLTQVLTMGMHVLAAVLLPVSIFLLATAIKQGAGQIQTQGTRIHY